MQNIKNNVVAHSIGRMGEVTSKSCEWLDALPSGGNCNLIYSWSLAFCQKDSNESLTMLTVNDA